MKTSSADSLFDTESIWAILLRIAPPVMLAQLIQAHVQHRGQLLCGPILQRPV